MDFPEKERRNHVDVYPGMMFFFITAASRRGLLEVPEDDFNRAAPWIVIHKELNTEYDCVRFLLLGPNSELKWHWGQLPIIRRVSDPAYEAKWQRFREIKPLRRK